VENGIVFTLPPVPETAGTIGFLVVLGILTCGAIVRLVFDEDWHGWAGVTPGVVLILVWILVWILIRARKHIGEVPNTLSFIDNCFSMMRPTSMGLTQRQWKVEELASMHAVTTGTAINLKTIGHLSIVLEKGPKLKLFEQQPIEDLNWVIRELVLVARQFELAGSPAARFLHD
jgi:hypothetical protein